MEQHEEKVNDEEDPYAQYDAEKDSDAKFFKTKDGMKVSMRIRDFALEKKSFKEGEKPKWTIIANLLQVNNQPETREWTTSASDVIKALRPFHKRKEELLKRLWLLERTKDAKTGKVKITFTDMTDLVPLGNFTAPPATPAGEKSTAGKGGSPSPAGNGKVEAFL